MDDLHLLLSAGRLSPPHTPLQLTADPADEARALLAEGAALLVAPARAAGHDREVLAQALQLFETAIAMAPALKVYAWERGFALLYAGRLAEAREQFEASCSVDDDDVEPWFWRFLCDARLHGVKAAQRGLQEFSGYDRRLCMMQVLDLFRGQGSVEAALEGACGDRHSAARASFAVALYFEALGEASLAVPLLRAVAQLDGSDGDTYLHGLARSHLGRMRRRIATQGPLARALSPKRLNSPFAGSGVGVVATLSQSC